MRRPSRALVTAAAAALALAATASAAWVTTASSGSATFAAATVSPPGGLVAASDCVRNVRNDAVLTWTASTSTFVDGYAIFRANGANAPKQIATVSGIGTTTYSDQGLGYNRTFTYTIRATAGAWSSADSTAATLTTPNRRCK